MSSGEGVEQIKVAVRVRPFNKREVKLGSKCVIEMKDKQTFIHNPEKPDDVKQFAYDYCYWSHASTDPHYADQQQIYSDIGTELLKNAFQGYNSTVFSYGQTGSGKSYTMMGFANEEDRGLIPRFCSEIFGRIEANVRRQQEAGISLSALLADESIKLQSDSEAESTGGRSSRSNSVSRFMNPTASAAAKQVNLQARAAAMKPPTTTTKKQPALLRPPKPPQSADSDAESRKQRSRDSDTSTAAEPVRTSRKRAHSVEHLDTEAFNAERSSGDGYTAPVISLNDITVHDSVQHPFDHDTSYTSPIPQATNLSRLFSTITTSTPTTSSIPITPIKPIHNDADPATPLYYAIPSSSALTPMQESSSSQNVDAFFDDSSLTKDYQVEVSYLEIYNERIRDLLNPSTPSSSLKIREHPKLGPYVLHLSRSAVKSYDQVAQLMDEGNRARTIAATQMNEVSSRSHAICIIKLTQTQVDLQTKVKKERVSLINLVDLAGSERVSLTGVAGERFKEGVAINKSLTTLGLVISQLADMRTGGSGGSGNSSMLNATLNNSSLNVTVVGSGGGAFKKRRTGSLHVNYRDSVLTWLLKESLGGNARTVMIATVSPSSANYQESVSTLRYAERAKRVVTYAVVNDDATTKVINELRTEIEELKKRLQEADGNAQVIEALRRQLQDSEAMKTDLQMTWEERIRATEELNRKRAEALQEMGVGESHFVLKENSSIFYLQNISQDPLLTGILVYCIKQGQNVVGAADNVDIKLKGSHVAKQHCIIENDGKQLRLTPMPGAFTVVNRKLVANPIVLQHLDFLIIGRSHLFKVVYPTEARKQRSGSVTRQSGEHINNADELISDCIEDDSEMLYSHSDTGVPLPVLDMHDLLGDEAKVLRFIRDYRLLTGASSLSTSHSSEFGGVDSTTATEVDDESNNGEAATQLNSHNQYLYNMLLNLNNLTNTASNSNCNSNSNMIPSISSFPTSSSQSVSDELLLHLYFKLQQMVDEANEYSNEMDKKVVFEVMFIANPTASKAEPDVVIVATNAVSASRVTTTLEVFYRFLERMRKARQQWISKRHSIIPSITKSEIEDTNVASSSTSASLAEAEEDPWTELFTTYDDKQQQKDRQISALRQQLSEYEELLREQAEKLQQQQASGSSSAATQMKKKKFKTCTIS